MKLVPKRRFKGFGGEWQERNLHDLADIVGGGTPSTGNPTYWNGEINWYLPTEIGDKPYANNSMKKITQLGLENSSAKILPANKTVLFTSRASIGDMAILRSPSATNQGFQSLVLKNGMNTYFVYSMGHLIKRQAKKNASGSTFMEISGKELGKIKLRVPTKAEQQKIGSFFEMIDEKVTLEESKLNKLTSMKQAYLHEMFPAEGENVPKRRFGTFNNEWTRKSLGELGWFGRTYTFSRASEGQGDCYHIHYGDIHAKFKGLITRSTRIPSIKTEGPYEFLSDGDIVIADASEDYTDLGKTVVIDDVNNRKIVAGLHTFKFTPNEKLDSVFYLYFSQTNLFKNFSAKAGTGISVFGLSKESLFNMKFYLPSKKEQQKIGSFFRKLDERIAKQEKKVEKLKALKQAYLEEMFV